MAPDADFSISEKQARELPAQMVAGNQDLAFLELVAAYGQQMRGILAARVMDESELEAEEQEFWAKIVQSAKNYNDKDPVDHWLSKIAKNQALNAQRRLNNRMKRVLSRVEMAAKMRDAGEDDDLDLEGLADKESLAASRSMQPDETIEREAAARRVARYLEQSENRATQLIRHRYIKDASYVQMVPEEHTTCSNMHTLISRALRAGKQALIDVYQGGDWEYAKNSINAWCRIC